MTELTEFAPAKVNLSLHVRGRRADGFHDLESLVVFADVGDTLTLAPGPALTLDVVGETAEAAGPPDNNLVIRAARALAERVPALQLGHFRLTKRLLVAAGLGGGSSDAAAALRLLARANGFAHDDRRVEAAAWATGADCIVCLSSVPSQMRGAGETVERLDQWPALDLVLVNPRVAVETRVVFAALGLQPGETRAGLPHPAKECDPAMMLVATRNDLAPVARALCPAIGEVEAALTAAGARIVRLSGSGATVWGLAEDAAHATVIAERLAAQCPLWWAMAVKTCSVTNR